MERLKQTELIKRLNDIRALVKDLVVEDLELIAHMIRHEVKEARLFNRYGKPFTPAQIERANGNDWNK